MFTLASRFECLFLVWKLNIDDHVEHCQIHRLQMERTWYNDKPAKPTEIYWQKSAPQRQRTIKELQSSTAEIELEELPEIKTLLSFKSNSHVSDIFRNNKLSMNRFTSKMNFRCAESDVYLFLFKFL